MYSKELEDILNKLNIFEKAYDTIRLVDPINKKVIELHDNHSINGVLHCFDFWGKNKVCDNCVSIRAYRDNITYIKMEYSKDAIYMVTAIPVELKDRRVVLELIKNATESLVLDTNEDNRQSEIHAMIDNMNNIALKDPLTGLYNRRYINEKLPINIANAGIAEQNLSIIMADIDFFKKVNDTYGHLVGDYTLQFFSKILSMGIKREGDWVARYGGEEFLICLPGASAIKAKEIAEAIRRNLEESLIDAGEHKFHITASFGICSSTPTHLYTIEELIEAADKKLYEAKHNGRNRVEV